MQNFTLGSHHFQPQGQVTSIAVTQNLCTACIGGQIAANRAAAFCGQTQGEQTLMITGGLLHILQNAACFHHHGVVVGIHAANLVQALQRQHQRSGAVVRRCAPAQTGIAALRDDGHAVLRA